MTIISPLELSVSNQGAFNVSCISGRSALIQHSSRDGDEEERWWISRWTTNWRANDHKPLLC